MVMNYTSYPFWIKADFKVGVEGGMIASRGVWPWPFRVNPSLSSIRIEFKANSKNETLNFKEWQ